MYCMSLTFSYLLLIPHITKQSYGVYFDNSNLTVIDINNLKNVVCGKKEVGLYRLKSSNIPLPSSKPHLQLLHRSYALVAQEDSRLWHIRFGHLGPSSQMLQSLPHFNVPYLMYGFVYMGSIITNLFPLKLLFVPHPFIERNRMEIGATSTRQTQG